MKRRVLMRRIRTAASSRDVTCSRVRQGSRHDFWEVGGLRVAIPRHREINEWTAEAIMRDLEPMLGLDWWRR